MIPRPPISTLFPYTTLFRSDPAHGPVDNLLASERNLLLRRCLGRLSDEQRAVVQLRFFLGAELGEIDRKSTRLNSSHPSISYAVFCLKKKNINYTYIYLTNI